MLTYRLADISDSDDRLIEAPFIQVYRNLHLYLLFRAHVNPTKVPQMTHSNRDHSGRHIKNACLSVCIVYVYALYIYICNFWFIVF